MASLISTVKSKILESIRDIDTYKAGTRVVRDARTGFEMQEDVVKRIWKSAVLDQHTRSLLRCVFTDDELIGECITEITIITTDRSQSSLPALYFVMPTTENAHRIAEDARQYRYTATYVIFAEVADDSILNILLQSHELSRLAEETGENGQSKLSIFDLSLDFFTLEAQVFSLKSSELFYDMYSPPRNEQSVERDRRSLQRNLQLTSKRIAGVCISLNENPLIRYYHPPNHHPLGSLNPHFSSPNESSEPVSRFRTTLARNNHESRAPSESLTSDHVTKILAEMVQKELDNYKKLQKGAFPVPKLDRNNMPIPVQQGTLIITDRSMDTIAPFIHEFTYQAMVHDLLRIKDNVYTYDFISGNGDHETVEATLGDKDKLWAELRHTHIVEAVATFKARLPKEVTSSGNDLDDVRDALANLSIEKENREQLSLHTNMATECMRIYKPTENDQILESVASIEQDCATGQTPDGKTPKNLIEEMVPLLDMREVKNSDKVRIVALYIQYRQGISDEDRRRLYLHARLTQQEQDAVTNLLHLGVRISRGKPDKEIKHLRPKKHVEDEYVLSRYKPMTRTILEDHVANRLDQTLFPYTRNPPSLLAPSLNRTGSSQSQSSQVSTASLRHTRADWTQKKKVEDGSKARIILFIAGGMTYSEMREVYLLSRSLEKHIYIGSTHAINPVGFIGELSMLGFGGPAPKIGKEKKRNETFQGYYDDLYYVQDEPRQPPPHANIHQSHANPTGDKLMKAPDIYAPLSGYRGPEEEKKKSSKLGRFLGVKK